MAAFQALPRDVLMQIMYLVSDDRGLCRLAQVNALLRDCADDDDVWAQLCHSPCYASLLVVHSVDEKLQSEAGDPSFRGWKRLCRKQKETRKRRALVNMILQFHDVRHGEDNYLRVVRDLNSLIDLDLSQTCIGTQGARFLARSFESLGVDNRLEVINLCGNEIRAEGALLLAPLAPARSLTVLDLRSNRLGPDGAAHVASFLRVNKSLSTLELASNFLGPEGASVLAQGFEANTSLRRLGLQNNAISCVGLRSVVTSASRVERLDVSSNDVRNAGAKCLLAHLQAGRGNLRSVDLTSNPIGSELATQLEALQSPALQVKAHPVTKPSCVVS